MYVRARACESACAFASTCVFSCQHVYVYVCVSSVRAFLSVCVCKRMWAYVLCVIALCANLLLTLDCAQTSHESPKPQWHIHNMIRYTLQGILPKLGGYLCHGSKVNIERAEMFIQVC